MRRLGLILTLIGLSLTGAVGQDISYTQYYVNLASVNPAFTGYEGFWDTKFGYRQGWRNFSDENRQVYVSSYGALKDGSALRTNSLRLSDPSRLQALENSKEVRRKHGVGGMLTNYSIGPFRSSTINGNYSFHIPVSDKYTWSLGTVASLKNQSIDLTGYTVRDEINDAFYQQLIQASNGRQTLYGIDLGTVVYSDEYYFGLSTKNLIHQMISGDDFLEVSSTPMVSFQTGGYFRISAQMELNTSLLIDYSKAAKGSWRLSARTRVREFVYGGFALEPGVKFSTLFGITVDKKMDIHYTYDRYVSNIGPFKVNVHELVIGVPLFNRYSNASKVW